MGDEDPAVEKAAETLSATECLGTRRTGALSIEKQQKEATFRERNHVPMKSDNACATQKCFDTEEVGDDNHELGETQKLQAREVHSHSETGQALLASGTESKGS